MLVKICAKMNLIILIICATTIVTIKAQGSLLSLEPAIALDSKDVELSVHRTRSLLPQVEETEHGNWSTLYEALDVYNVRKLAENWSKGKYPVTEECSKDITVFIDGLKREELWARKSKPLNKLIHFLSSIFLTRIV